MNVGDKCRVADPVTYSSERWIAGKNVVIMEIDEGQPWEHTVVRVQVEGEHVWMDPRDLVQVRPLRPVLEQVARQLGGFHYDADDPFGGLPVIAEEDWAVPGATSDTCYICRDPEYAERGLPLCRACPACGGHVAADGSVCDDCGLDDQLFWMMVDMVLEEPESPLVGDVKEMFFDEDYRPKDPTVAELSRAITALRSELYDEQG